jgi:hypothetical protein
MMKTSKTYSKQSPTIIVSFSVPAKHQPRRAISGSNIWRSTEHKKIVKPCQSDPKETLRDGKAALDELEENFLTTCPKLTENLNTAMLKIDIRNHQPKSHGLEDREWNTARNVITENPLHAGPIYL